jgi:hypothetical protein
LECLVGPFILGDPAILADYASFFADPAVQVVPLSAAVCERAARIRATHTSNRWIRFTWPPLPNTVADWF